MLKLIGDMLKKEGITYTMLSGKVPVKKRGALIKEFEENPACSVFLSSESGGAGLNLQEADTVINFELPRNPAKKNQRIGRIDRIGQQKQKLHVFNLLSYQSIEIKIATGLLLKQNLFEGVLSSGNLTDEVDFSEKGKSQFIKQLQEVIKDNDFATIQEEDTFISENPEETVLQEIVNENVASNITDNSIEKEINSTPKIEKKEVNFQQMEEVMTKEMEFLTGIYNMSTGDTAKNADKPKVNVDRET